VYDLERLNGRVVLGSANARDLTALRLSLGRLPGIKELLGTAGGMLVELAERLDPGSGIPPLSLAEQIVETRRLYEDMLSFHEPPHGVRIARKHLAWALERWHEAGFLSPEEAARWRARLVREDDADRVRAVLAELAGRLLEREAA